MAYAQVIELTVLVVYTFIGKVVVPCVQNTTLFPVLVAAFTGAVDTVMVLLVMPTQPAEVVASRDRSE